MKQTRQLKQVTIVGCDGNYLKSIISHLDSQGYVVNKHVEGRHKNAQHRSTAVIPAGTELVIMFTEYLNHNIRHNFATEAKKLGIRVLYCRTSVNDLRGKLGCTKTESIKQAMTCV